MPSKKRDILPGIFEKQDELYLNPQPGTALISRAKEFEQKGLLVDALEYYRVADDRDAIKCLKEKAVSEGDLFLYLSACRALEENPSGTELENLAGAAQSKGKEAYAAEAVKLLTDRN